MIFILIYRQIITHLNPGSPPAIQLVLSPPPPTIPQEKKKATKPLGHALDPSTTRKRIPVRTSWLTLYRLTSQVTRIFSEYQLQFLTLFNNPSTTTSRRNSSNFRALSSWIKTGKNAESPGNKRNVHVLTVSLTAWPNYHIEIRSQGLPGHP